MKKKMLSVLFLMFFSTFVVFAGGQKVSNNGKYTLSVFNWGNDQDVKINNAVYARFTAKNPDITVQDNFITGWATWSEFVVKLLTQIKSGNSPDMVYMAIEGAVQLASNDVLIPLDNYIANDPDIQKMLANSSQKLIDALKVDGKSYYFPNVWNGLLMYYNKKLLAEAGLPPPSQNWTWQDLRRYAIAMSKGSGADRVYGLGIPVFSSNMNVFPYSNGTSTLSSDLSKSNLMDPKVIESYQFINDLIWKDRAMAVPEQGQDVVNLFAAGRVAMMPYGHNCIEQLLANGFTDWDVVFFPLNDKEKGTSTFGIIGYGILKSCQNPDLAWEIIKEYASMETQMDIAAAGISNPMNRVAATSEIALRYPEHAERFYEVIDTPIRPAPAPMNNSEYEEILYRAYYQMMSKQQGVTPILRQADIELAASFARMNK
jgi:multiple sugar transport system substrate-binding protein